MRGDGCRRCSEIQRRCAGRVLAIKCKCPGSGISNLARTCPFGCRETVTTRLPLILRRSRFTKPSYPESTADVAAARSWAFLMLGPVAHARAAVPGPARLGAQLRGTSCGVRCSSAVRRTRGSSFVVRGDTNAKVNATATLETTPAPLPGVAGLKLSPVFNEVLAEEIANQGEGSVQKARPAVVAKIQPMPVTRSPLAPANATRVALSTCPSQCLCATFLHDATLCCRTRTQIYGPAEWTKHRRVFRYVRHLQNLGGCVAGPSCRAPNSGRSHKMRRNRGECRAPAAPAASPRGAVVGATFDMPTLSLNLAPLHPSPRVHDLRKV